jgi:hypothetical protein
MSHEEETANRWVEIGRQEEIYDQWASFFRGMMGRPKQAAALCDLGMKVVRGEAMLGLSARRSVEYILGGVVYG